MKFGVAMFPTDEAVDPVSWRGWSRSAASSRSSSPSTPTSRPAGARRTRRAASCRASTATSYDPFVALAAAAAATETLRSAPAICLVVERDPITTAKEVASARPLSDGRFLFGVGAGWNDRGDGEPRHRPVAALRADARADRGDEGDLDQGRGGVPRRATSTSIRSGPGRSRCRSRTRRSSSAATAAGARPRARVRRRVDPEPGRRRGEAARASAEASAPCGEEAGRDGVPVTFSFAEPSAEALERYAEAGVTAASSGCRRRPRTRPSSCSTSGPALVEPPRSSRPEESYPLRQGALAPAEFDAEGADGTHLHYLQRRVRLGAPPHPTGASSPRLGALSLAGCLWARAAYERRE